MSFRANLAVLLFARFVFLSQSLLFLTAVAAGKGGSHNHGDPIPVSTNSNVTFLQPEFFTHLHSRRVQIKYGPFITLPSTINNGMHTFEAHNATKPCSDCLITWIQAGLQYLDGSYANADTGMWLHHVVMANVMQRSSTCPLYSPDRFFASGNERTPANICVNGTNEAGYYLSSDAELLIAPELMNETPDSRPVVVTITYEYIPSFPRHFSNVTPVWLDITGVCGGSDYPVPNDTTTFSPVSPPWIANVTGKITYVAGHIHDGGLDVEIQKNGVTICDSVATYGATPGYVEMNSSMVVMPMNGSMYGQDTVHISNMSACHDIGHMKKGEQWGVKANYDLMQHAPMLDMDGSPSPVMGISLLYVAQKKEDCDEGGQGGREQ